MRLFEIKSVTYDAWRNHSLKDEIFFDNINVDRLKDAPVHVIPYSYFRNIGHFEQFTKNDIINAKTTMSEREQRILNGFLNNHPMPYIIAATETDGKIEVIDGFTRAAIAIPLGIKIKAKVLNLSTEKVLSLR